MTPSKVAKYLGLRKNIVLMLASIVLIGAGEEMWMRFLPKYLQVLGASVFVIGLYDALKTLLGAVYAYPGGIIVDHWGQRRSLILFTLLSAAGYALVLLVPHWGAVLAGTFLFLAWSALSLPAMFSVVAASLSRDQHTMGIGVQSMIRRVPVIIGPILGGWAMDRWGLETGVKVGLAASIALALLTALLQTRMDNPDVPEPPPHNLLTIIQQFSPSLKRLLVSDILIRFCERLPFAWVVIYAMDHGGVSASQAGLLIALEMASAMLCYIPAAHFADRHGREPFVLATFAFFTLFPITLLWANNLPLLTLAFIVRGLKEFGEPARKALIIGFAPPEIRGRAIGAYYLVRDVIVTLGAFLGAALWAVSPQANFIAAAALGAAGTLVYWRTMRR